MTVSASPDASRSSRVYSGLRASILGGEYEPTQALKPQELASKFDVSLAVAREALLRLVGEGLADRLPNRGFTVPRADAQRWREIAEARSIIEPQAIRLAVERGDLAWEAQVRAAHHSLSRTLPQDPATGRIADDWSRAHHAFHRSLLEGCGNATLLDTFERLWDASELTRQWSGAANPDRDAMGEHAALENACLDRDADRAAELLRAHLTQTVAALSTLSDSVAPARSPRKDA
jgi:DNA-binding GntR family transcriptional regulator